MAWYRSASVNVSNSTCVPSSKSLRGGEGRWGQDVRVEKNVMFAYKMKVSTKATVAIS